ncbi:hypothetical protein PJM47_26275 [Mycobacterium kansasii]
MFSWVATGVGAATALISLAVAGCNDPSQNATPATTIASSHTLSTAPETGKTCNLEPTYNDLLIWEHWPRLGDISSRVGDVDGPTCKPTIEVWKEGEPKTPGFCAKIAWFSDNPDYDVDIRPAPPLKHVFDETGDCY